MISPASSQVHLPPPRRPLLLADGVDIDALARRILGYHVQASSTSTRPGSVAGAGPLKQTEPRVLNPDSPLSKLLDTLPQTGEVRWMGLRPARRAPMTVVAEVEARVDAGLVGDRWRGRPGGKRQVTLIQAEHLAVIAALLGLERVDPAQLRRNIAVAGINLLALKGRRFRIGEAVLEATGPCDPCSRLEETFGPGGYNAVRGHGGINARVLQGGLIRLGDPVRMLES